MSTLKNMKFKVESPEQSERLQKILCELGYRNYSDDTRHLGGIITYDEGVYQTIYLDSYYKHDYEAFNTDDFLAAHKPPTSPFRAMKFKVGSPTQSESLQKALQALGYDHAHPAYKGKCVFTDRKDIFTDSEGVIYSSITEECYDNEEGEEMDTEEFLVKHAEFTWFDNTGEFPNIPDETFIEAEFRDGEIHIDNCANGWDWSLSEDGYAGADLLKWRYHRSEKPEEYFVQPKTKPTLKVDNLSDIGDKSGTLTWGTIEPKRNKYMREIKPGIYCDVYEVLRAFNVTDGALSHMVKKCLAVGQRGHKNATEDYKDIVASAQRALELHLEWKDSE